MKAYEIPLRHFFNFDGFNPSLIGRYQLRLSATSVAEKPLGSFLDLILITRRY